MKKLLVITFLCTLGAVLFSGCQNMKDDIDNLKNPIPTGVVILQDELNVQNGMSIEIPFRVNPSNFVPTKENVVLDVISSQITRAEYGSSIPEYTLVDIQPDKNAQGEELEGQWLAVVEAAEGAYYGEARLALILAYTDARGNQVQMTSSSISLLNSHVKLTENMVALNGPSSCTYWNTTTDMPIPTSTQLVPRPISEGSSTLFDLATVSVESAVLTGAQAGSFTLQSDESGLKWNISANTPMLEFEEDAQYVPITLEVKLRDLIGGNEVTITKTIRFYKTEYTVPQTMEYKLSEWPMDSRQNIELGEYLAQIGVTAELFTRYSEHESLPVILKPAFEAKDATGENNVSSKYRAVFILKNHVEDDPDPDAISKTLCAPETNYLQQRFYSKPLEGEYQLWLSFQYCTAESLISENPQPVIQATIKVPVKILP